MRSRLAFCLLMLTCGPALSDQIDGDWCSATGQHLKIEGPAITIPSGAEIIGTYTRHGFRYEGPEGDPEAGQVIEMRQLSDEAMVLVRSIEGAARDPETWTRCQATS